MSYQYQTHILAFGPHPDDVEVGCGGVIRQATQQGKRCVIVDCTTSQYSTRGNDAMRLAEAQQAAEILGVTERVNLGWHDTHLIDDDAHRREIARLIRYYQPEVVLVPSVDDRHPDHEVLPRIVRNGCFLAGLSKIVMDELSVHRPRLLLQYAIWEQFEPDVIVPLSHDAWQTKMAAFQSFVSQVPTNAHAFDYLKGRAQMRGFHIRRDYGEGFKTFGERLGVESFDELLSGYW